MGLKYAIQEGFVLLFFGVGITHRELRPEERDSHPLHSSVSESPPVSSSPAWAPLQD